MKISIVIALLNEAEGLARMRDKVVAVLNAMPELDWEIILVDDGSTDSSWETICGFSSQERRIRGVRLSKNFGNHAALLAGLQVATGDAAMNLAADLQTPPELIPRLCGEHRAGAEIVFGARHTRVDGLVGKLTGWITYRLITYLSDAKMPSKGIDVFLLSRAALDEFLKLSGRNNSILSRIMGLGFAQRTIEYEPSRRNWGRSKWTLKKKIKLLGDTLLAHSATPIRICFPLSALGIASGVAGLFLATILVGPALTVLHLVSAMLFVSGVQLGALALLGEYVFRAYQESAAVPVFIVRDDTTFRRITQCAEPRRSAS